MLMGLSIRDVVLIEALDLQFHEGFSALTGETGAGKSILLDSLSLALGMRGDTSLIRRGAEQAIVSAEFDLRGLSTSHPLLVLLREQGFEGEDSSLILRRVLHHNNKSRALLNDHPVSIGLLREIGQLILEIHGQFDHLMNVNLHHKILDSFATSHSHEMEGLLILVADAYKALKNAEEELAHQRTLQEEALKKQVYYKQILGDLEKLSPKEQEEEILLKERQDVAHYGKIADAVQEALTALRTPTDFQTSLYSIQKNLERVNVIELKELKSAAEALDRASIELQEAYELLRGLYDLNQERAHKLSTIEERLYALRAVARKYGFQPMELYASYQQAQQAVEALGEGDGRLHSYEIAVTKCLNEYSRLAGKIREIRLEAAKVLSERVMAELPPLKLHHATFRIDVKKGDQPGPRGLDHIEFLIAANKGQELAPLAKSASGGEMARLMLALKVVLSHHGYISTIVFDEIDTGVGGAVAAAIGQRLSLLGKNVQVLAITHSPQVAAFAQHHFHVCKKEHKQRMETSVEILAGNDRLEEIARMLSGSTITNEARAAAQQLLGDSVSQIKNI
ncbi:MAG: DNA repair protein RecN [Alphaproteobacteria bacterium]|jgi:DNA repair protein RecN (Recombination protein N)|nr:DNA repair protein RecN [Alphaproteobacteria bacterium]